MHRHRAPLSGPAPFFAGRCWADCIIGISGFDLRLCPDLICDKDNTQGYTYLEIRCLGCDTHQTVALDIVRRPKTTLIHELERYMRCKDCSEVRGYPYKRSHLIALRRTKISASDPPSFWWPVER